MNFERTPGKDDTLVEDIHTHELLGKVPAEAEEIFEKGASMEQAFLERIQALYFRIDTITDELEKAQETMEALEIPLREALQELSVLEKDFAQAQHGEPVSELFARITELRAYIQAVGDFSKKTVADATNLAIERRDLEEQRVKIQEKYFPEPETFNQN